MKQCIVLFGLLAALASSAQNYQPTNENLQARRQFQDNKYGMFIH